MTFIIILFLPMIASPLAKVDGYAVASRVHGFRRVTPVQGRRFRDTEGSGTQKAFHEDEGIIGGGKGFGLSETWVAA